MSGNLEELGTLNVLSKFSCFTHLEFVFSADLASNFVTHGRYCLYRTPIKWTVVIFDLLIRKLILIISKPYVRSRSRVRANLLHVSFGSIRVKWRTWRISWQPGINFYLHSKTFLINSTINYIRNFLFLSLL